MPPINDHPLRYTLANELHARPFPKASVPSQAAYLAMMADDVRDKDAERAHLINLLDRFGAPHPQPDATHYSGSIGRFSVKWESHTEFVTYTIFAEGVDDTPFATEAFSVFPTDWLETMPGQRITSALIRIETAPEDEGIEQHAQKWFVPESLAISRALDDAFVIAADFRIDSAGHMRLAVFTRENVGPQRIGRVVQRLCEIETYKTMAMLGLTCARQMTNDLNHIDVKLTSLLADMAGVDSDPADVLAQLLEISGTVEKIGAQSAYRFAATNAYSKIVDQRIQVLREERFQGRQTFGEFMMRRFDPAMRTAEATESRLKAISDRALRAGDLLRTKVDVARSAQNQALLTSMDKRADLQLRLQRTVEGLSIVAVSYYAVNILLYMLGPFAEGYGLSKTLLAACVTPVVLCSIWFFLRRLRRNLE